MIRLGTLLVRAGLLPALLPANPDWPEGRWLLFRQMWDSVSCAAVVAGGYLCGSIQPDCLSSLSAISINGTLILYLILFGLARLTSGSDAPIFLLNGLGRLCMSVHIPADCLYILCFHTVLSVCCSWGRVFHLVVGPFLGLLLVSSGGLPEWNASVI